MLKTTRSPERSTSKELGVGNGEVVGFSVGGGGGGKEPQSKKRLDHLTCRPLEGIMATVMLLDLVLVEVLMNH